MKGLKPLLERMECAFQNSRSEKELTCKGEKKWDGHAGLDSHSRGCLMM